MSIRHRSRSNRLRSIAGSEWLPLAVGIALAFAIVVNPPPQTVNAASIPNGDPLSGRLMQAPPLFLGENSARGELPHAPDAAIDILNNRPDLDQPISAVDGAMRHEAERSFDTWEFELDVADDKSRPNSEADACVYPDGYGYLRTLTGGEDKCGVVEPDAFTSQIFGLPFLALTAWVLAILAAAGTYYFFGDRRSRRWLRRLRTQGMLPKAARRRRLHSRGTPPSSSRRRARSRSYAG
jgi:hypothetical protein